MASLIWKGSGDPLCGSIEASNILRTFDPGTWTCLRLACRLAWGKRAAGSSSAYHQGSLDANDFFIGFGAGAVSAGGLAGNTLCAGFRMYQTMTIAAGATTASSPSNKGFAWRETTGAFTNIGFGINSILSMVTTDTGNDYSPFILEILKVSSAFKLSAFHPINSGATLTAAQLDTVARMQAMEAGASFGVSVNSSNFTPANYATNGPFNNIHFVSPVGTCQLLLDEVNIYKIS